MDLVGLVSPYVVQCLLDSYGVLGLYRLVPLGYGEINGVCLYGISGGFPCIIIKQREQSKFLHTHTSAINLKD